MILKVLFTSALLIGYCKPQDSLEDILADIFGPSPHYASAPTPSNNGAIISESKKSFQTKGCEHGQKCVASYSCKKNTIVTDGFGLIDVRFKDDELKNCSYLGVCCPIGNIVDKPITKSVPVVQHPNGCGYRNIDGVGFKITGNENFDSEFGEFPWMLGILKKEQAIDTILNIYQCGGSLITPSVALTAAHCVQTRKPNELKVRAGEWDTQGKNEVLPDQDRHVIDIVVHEEFYKGGLFNDIALLFLESPFQLDDNVQPICLPPANTNFDHSRCYATGWGKDTFGQTGKYSVIMKKIDLPMVPRDQCQNALRTTRLGEYFQLHKSFVCAGGEFGKDTCKGDGGSPLVCPIPGAVNRYYQAGIVAWGIGCGNEIPGVYASVAHLRPWIDEQLAYKNVDKSYFTP